MQKDWEESFDSLEAEGFSGRVWLLWDDESIKIE